MKKLAIAILSLFCIAVAITSCSDSSNVLPPPPVHVTISADEAAAISAEYIQNVSFSNVTTKAEDLLKAYVDEAKQYLTSEYPVSDLLTIVNTVSGITSSELLTGPTFTEEEKSSLKTAIDNLSSFTADMPYTSAFIKAFKGYLEDSSTTPWTSVFSQIANLNSIISEVASKLSIVLADTLGNVEAESGNYTLSVSDYEFTTESIEDVVSTVLQTALLGSSSTSTCDVPASLTLKVTSETLNSELFKSDNYQYSGSVYMKADFNIIRKELEEINDYDLYVDFNTLTLSSDELAAYRDDERNIISFSDISATLNAYADIEGSEITIENVLNENPATIAIDTSTGAITTQKDKPVTRLFTIDLEKGSITCDDREVPFADVVALTDQGN